MQTIRRWRSGLDNGTKKWLGYFRRSFVERLPHVSAVRRNLVVWLVVMLCLIMGAAAQSSLYRSNVTSAMAADGGSYVEGTTDKLTTISPLATSTDTERAMSLLVYPSLLRYDETGHLIGYLASGWSVSGDARTWTVKLKPALHWSDGKAITAQDVVFTARLLSQSTGSALSGVNVSSKDDDKVVFSLPSASASFGSSLTFGVLPQHIYSGKGSSEINTAINNGSSLISGGPFRLVQANSTNGSWRFVQSENYWGVKPRLSEIIYREYDSDDDLLSAYKSGAISSANNLKLNQIKNYKAVAKLVEAQGTDGVYVIFNTDSELFGDVRARQAVRLLVDRSKIRRDIARDSGVKELTPLETPIARGIYDEVDNLSQPKVDRTKADQLLAAAGWGGDDDQTSKVDRTIKIVAASDNDNAIAAQKLEGELKEAGFKAKLALASSDVLRQQYIQTRNYDIIVYSYHLGGDADVSAYWSSSQASTGLNLANYTNRRVDIALAAGRSNVDESVRSTRYATFVNDWLNDCPAIALYQSKVYRAEKDDVSTVEPGDVITDASGGIARILDWSAGRDVTMRTP